MPYAACVRLRETHAAVRMPPQGPSGETVYAADSKSAGVYPHVGSSPTSGTNSSEQRAADSE